MQIAGVDIYVNHPVLHLGATDWFPLSLALNPAPTASRDTRCLWFYSGFAAFRRRLAETEGFVLFEMRGFGGERR
ncbi:hypothetical protein [Streptomyces sp. NPDC048266]|uniref:hypothetical protein n=1 Tax=Streptomyces sp. NPDC048266 TaxID=3155787 RepID=UPI00340FB657